jgi:glucose/mannose transport system permease protein
MISLLDSEEGVAPVAQRPAVRNRILAAVLARIAMSFSYLVLVSVILYVVGFTLWTMWISVTDSTLLPDYTYVGFKHYQRLIQARVWQVAYVNLAIYATGFISITTVVGMLLAILIDQKIKSENVLRTIYLYPMALSFVITGTVWAWILNPSIGIEHLAHTLGWVKFHFDWLVDRDMAIYTVVIAAVWQASGFAMALFLAGLRSLDNDLYKAAQIDGASASRMYIRIFIPAIWPVVVSVLIVLLQIALKTYDLVRALTAGGPGIATTLPTNVVYDYMFQRGQMGAGSATAVMLLLSLLIVILPYLALQKFRGRKQAGNG